MLAAGRSSRVVGGAHKLLAEFDGVPLVRRAATVASGAGADCVVIVTGHRRDEIMAAVGDVEVDYVHNIDYASGIASSIVAGLSASKVPACDGALVMLADMHAVTADDLRNLIAVFRSLPEPSFVRAVCGATPGNPVVIPSALFEVALGLRGDVGARDLVSDPGLPVVGVDIGEPALLDVDTREAVEAAGGSFTH